MASRVSEKTVSFQLISKRYFKELDDWLALGCASTTYEEKLFRRKSKAEECLNGEVPVPVHQNRRSNWLPLDSSAVTSPMHLLIKESVETAALMLVQESFLLSIELEIQSRRETLSLTEWISDWRIKSSFAVKKSSVPNNSLPLLF